MKTQLAAALMALVALATAGNALSQHMPGKSRSSGARAEDSRERTPRAMQPPEPFAAFERELPSLKVDLRITEAQLESWRLVEREVRFVAELDRTRIRQAMALRDASQPPPGALALVSGWADADRRRSEATAEVARHLGALFDILDEEQRRTLDRRVALSQAEPLGR
jgi:hypothetical protein